jgi:hypothetical protein
MFPFWCQLLFQCKSSCWYHWHENLGSLEVSLQLWVKMMLLLQAGVWYHDRWVQNLLMALERAACRQPLGHSSMCCTFSFRWPHAKHHWSILLLIWAQWCMVRVHSWAYFEIWRCWPGVRALKDEPFAYQSNDLKVSSVHSVSIVESCFFESLMMVSWRVVAVAAVVMWQSCFFVTSQPSHRRPAMRYGIQPLWEPAYLVVGVVVHQVAYLVGIIVCDSFICEIFWAVYLSWWLLTHWMIGCWVVWGLGWSRG